MSVIGPALFFRSCTKKRDQEDKQRVGCRKTAYRYISSVMQNTCLFIAASLIVIILSTSRAMQRESSVYCYMYVSLLETELYYVVEWTTSILTRK